MNRVRVTLFKHGRESFLSLLREHKVEFTEERLRPGDVRASGDNIWIGPALQMAAIVAQILIMWLKGRPTRKVIVQTKTKLVHLEGYSVEQAKALLEKSLSAADVSVKLIQTDKDEP